MKTAYLSFGSNIGDKEDFIYKAYEFLEYDDNIKVVTFSSLYKTEPYGNPDMSWFLNSVVKIKTSYSPEKLLKKCNDIEKKLGRVRDKSLKFTARTIDIDILFYENEVIETENLKVPHYDVQNRSFMLLPMSEIEPNFVHPVLQKNVQTLFENLSQKQDIEVFNG